MPSDSDDLSNLDFDLSKIDFSNSKEVWTASSVTSPAASPFRPELVSADLVAAEVIPTANSTFSIPHVRSSWISIRRLLHAVPAWALSLVLHTGLLLVLGAISLEPLQDALAVLVVSDSPTDGEELEAFDMETVDAAPPGDVEETPEVALPTSQSLSVTSELKSEVNLETTLTANAKVELSSMSQLTPSEIMDASLSHSMSKSLNSRSGKARRELLEKFGGNQESEKAVAMALLWLSKHQNPRDGGWSFEHTAICKGECNHPGTERGRNGATGLALMTFLGAGQTHLEGEYKKAVHAGLNFLMASMVVKGGELPTGSWYSKEDDMYGHGIAAIAMCEAYAMTRDPALAKPAQLSLNFIAYAQNPQGGGWQYRPQVGGDTSVVGWQLMALKSGAMGGLNVLPTTLKKAERFLDSVQMNKGAFYGYRAPDSNINGRLATSACGLLCRMYMGWPKTNPALEEGVRYIAKRGPHPTNVYLNYYATQVIKQYGGKEWEDWNPKMRDQLIKSQEKSGHAMGSWNFDDTSAGNPSKAGGRLYLTTMSAMILEVYYRYLPIYAEQTEDVFKL